MTKPMPQVSTDLLKARDLLLKRGWCQQSFAHKDGNLCAAEAIFRCVEDKIGAVERKDAAITALVHEIAGMNFMRWDKVGIVVCWNDARGRTKREVLDTFQAAAMRAME